MENKNRGNKTMVWVALGCLAVVVCILAVVLFGFGGLMWLGSQTPENADVKVNTPPNAGVGDDIKIQITVTNTSSEVLELSSIDISLNYLKGFTITQVDPPYSDIGQYDSLGGGETFQTYYFYQSIEPGMTMTIVFDVKAVIPGDFSGVIDVCIDSDFNCVTNIPRTVVK
jgi:hypothetical protein